MTVKQSLEAHPPSFKLLQAVAAGSTWPKHGAQKARRHRCQFSPSSDGCGCGRPTFWSSFATKDVVAVDITMAPWPQLQHAPAMESPKWPVSRKSDVGAVLVPSQFSFSLRSEDSCLVSRF
eukprot:s416_g30.t1